MLPNGDVTRRRGADRARAGQDRLRLRHDQHDAARRRRWATARTASRCCATRTVTASPRTRETFLEGLNQPFGMALLGDTFYVGNTDGVVAFPYAAGATPHRRTTGAQADRRSSPAGTGRAACLPSPDGRKLYVGRGLAQQHRRARHRPSSEGRACHLRARSRQPHAAASSPRACATPWASPGSPAQLVVRMASENSRCGYTRIQGALSNRERRRRLRT